MMQIDPHQLLMLLQWTDSSFPTGAFAHSGGLETYIQHAMVRNAGELGQLIAVKLESATYTDFIIVHCAMTAYQNRDAALLHELDELCAASKPARETRESSEKVGRRLLSSALNVYPNTRLSAYRADIERKVLWGHHAVVQGMICAALGIEPRIALLAYGYALAANQTAASIKLMAMGQTQAQAVLAASGEAIHRAVEVALTLTLDDFGSFTTGLDIRTMQHEHLFRRLFIS